MARPSRPNRFSDSASFAKFLEPTKKSTPANRPSFKDLQTSMNQLGRLSRGSREKIIREGIENFKKDFTKPVDNTGGTLLQMTDDAPMSLTQFRQNISNQFGPTPGEIAQDAMKAIGRAGEAGFIPFVSGAMRAGEAIKNMGQAGLDFLSQFAPEGGLSNFFQPAQTNLSARIAALSPNQRSFYNSLVSDTNQNISVQESLVRAEAIPTMAVGGIATLQ